MTVVGITGSLGTGKTTVAGMFAAKGAKVLNADRLSHQALKRGRDTYKKVVSLFGRDILNRNKSINKGKLAAAVFGDKKKLKRLTAIIHPAVIKEIRRHIKKGRPEAVVVIDAPLLIEAGLKGLVDTLIVVKAGSKVQLSRCRRKRGLKEKEVRARLKNQMPLAEKIKMADYVIDNNGTLKQTRKEADRVWEKIRK